MRLPIGSIRCAPIDGTPGSGTKASGGPDVERFVRCFHLHGASVCSSIARRFQGATCPTDPRKLRNRFLASVMSFPTPSVKSDLALLPAASSNGTWTRHRDTGRPHFAGEP